MLLAYVNNYTLLLAPYHQGGIRKSNSAIKFSNPFIEKFSAGAPKLNSGFSQFISGIQKSVSRMCQIMPRLSKFSSGMPEFVFCTQVFNSYIWKFIYRMQQINSGIREMVSCAPEIVSGPSEMTSEEQNQAFLIKNTIF